MIEEVCPDHIHMLMEVPPNTSASSFAVFLKWKISLMIFEKYANQKYKYENRQFWSRGTALPPQEKIYGVYTKSTEKRPDDNKGICIPVYR